MLATNDGVCLKLSIETLSTRTRCKLPIVAAINKIDNPGAEPEKIKVELANHQVVGVG